MIAPARHSRIPLRVLLVSPLPPPSGGIGRWTVLVLDWLATKPAVAVRSVDISPRWRTIEDMRIWRRVVGGVLQGVRDAWRTLVQMVVFRPHVLHLNTSARLRGPWDTAMLALAAVGGVRTIYHLRMGRLPEVMARKGWEWWGLRGALQLAGQVVVLDKGSEEALKRFLPAERVVRLPNAIAATSTKVDRDSPGQPSVLYLGYVVPTKGMKELMEAWRELRPMGWRLRLAGLGSASYQGKLLEMVGPESRVEFLGDLPPEGASRLMQGAEIFVLPTYTEGFPNVILEAMAAGKAIISTRVGAVAEMLDADGDEPCGLVINPRNTAALAVALRQLLSDPQLRATLGRRAEAKVKRAYTTDVVFGRLLRLWSDAAGRSVSAGEPSCSLATKRLTIE